MFSLIKQVHEISIDGEVVHLTEPLTQEYEEKRQYLDLVGKRLNPYKLTEFIGYNNHVVDKLESGNGTNCYVNVPMQLIGKNVLLQEWQKVRYYQCIVKV